MASLADLNWYLSGGTSNTNPAASLGGAKGGQIGSQGVSGSMPGVSIDRSEGNPAGIGTLTYIQGDDTLTWAAVGENAGAAVDVSTDGEYVLFSGTAGYLVVNVTNALLPQADAAQIISISQPRNALFDDITKDESFNGKTEYRCFYLWNDHPSEALIECAAYIASQPAGADTIEIGLDSGGVNSGTTAAATVPDESTAPAGVVFSSPAGSGDAISIGDIPAGEGIAIWVKRIVPSRTLTSSPDDTLMIAIEVRY